MVVFPVVFCALLGSALAAYVNPSEHLPPDPVLPAPVHHGYVNLSKVDIWYAQYGPPVAKSVEPPILFLHGAFGSSRVFGNQLTTLQQRRPDTTIIAIDSRMQGRSTGVDGPISYDLMTGDVEGVLDHFKIPKATIVGWSDGGIIGLDLAIHQPSRIYRLFAFGASFVPGNVNATALTSPTFSEYLDRAKQFYLDYAPEPKFHEAYRKINHMLETLPNYHEADFKKIPTLYDDCEGAPLIWIVDAADEEAVKRGVARKLHNFIYGSGMLILPSVSHFAFMQDPATFNDALLRFLNYKVDCSG